MSANKYPNLDIEVMGKYLERPDLQTIVGIYSLDIVLKPQISASEIITGKQLVFVRNIGNLFAYGREKTNLPADALYGEVQKSSLADWGWTFSIDDFVNADVKNATKYIQSIKEYLEKGKKVKGIAFDTRLGFSNEH